MSQGASRSGGAAHAVALRSRWVSPPKTLRDRTPSAATRKPTRLRAAKAARHRFLPCLLICLHSASGLAQSAPGGTVGDYAALKQSVLYGQSVAFVSDLTKCRTPSGAPGPNVSGASTFSAFYVTEQSILASETILFEAPDGRMLLKYIRILIFPDNHAEFALKKLVPTTYEPVGEETNYQCRLDDGSLVAHTRP